MTRQFLSWGVTLFDLDQGFEDNRGQSSRFPGDRGAGAHDMQRSYFHTESLPSERRWQAWNDNLSEFAIDATGALEGAGFEGRIDHCVMPSGLSFTLLESHAPQRISSTPGKVGDVFWLAVSLSGASRLDLGEGAFDMVPGDILYGKRGAPSSLDISTEFRTLLVNIPASLMDRKLLLPLPNKAIHVSATSGIGRVFSGLLSAVAESFDDINDMLAGSIEAALPQFLLGSLFGEGADQLRGGSVAVRAGVLQRIWRRIEARLEDPDVSLADVAAEQGLSVRYVQKLFEESGQSFTNYLRKRRLEQSRADLANQLNVDISITSICFRWGFNDAATFSRAFREEFGQSPREYRRAQTQSSAVIWPKQRLAGLSRLQA